MIIVDLIYNLAVLIALSVLSGFVDIRFNRIELKGKILQGFLFGLTAIIGMLYPFILSEGLIFDGRSIVISLCVLFFGPIAGLLASVMALIYRLILGGPGVIMGILVIVSSYLIGYIFHIRRNAKSNQQISIFQFYKLGLLVHAAMLLLVLTLPLKDILSVYKSISFTVIGIYPLVTILIGKILLDQEQNRLFVKRLSDNEERLRLSLKAANQGLFDLNVKTGDAIVNDEYATMLGYDPQTFKETNAAWIERLHPDEKEITTKAYLDYIEDRTKEYRVEFRQRTKDNNWKWILSTGKITEYDYDGKPVRMLGTHTDITELKQTVIALRKSEEKFAKMFRSSPEAIILTSLKNGVIVDVNEAAITLTGYGKKDLIGYNTILTNVWFNQKQLNNYSEQFLQETIGSNFETQIRSKSGDIKYVLVSGEVIEFNDEKFILSVIKDITERNQAEEAIQIERDFSNALLDGLPGIFYFYDQNMKFLRWNKNFEFVSGYSCDEIEKMNPLDFFTEGERELMKEKINDVFTSNYSEVEADFLSKNGKITPYYLNGLKIRYNNQDCLIGVGIDITQRKLAEKNLQESEEHFRTLFEQASDGIFVSKGIGNFLDVNSAGCKMLGFSHEELLKMSVTDLIDIDETSRIDSEMKRLQSNGNSKSEWKIKRKDGTCFIGEVTVKQLNDGRLQSFLRDATQRRKAEDAVLKTQEQLRALSARLEQIREDERIHISRELHDNLGQSLTALKMDVTWLTKKIRSHDQYQDPVFIEKSNTIQELIDSLIGNVKRISSELRPNMLEYLGLMPSLEWLMDDFKKRTELDCNFKTNITNINLNQKIALSVFRVFQEALTNIIRHSGATNVSLVVEEDESQYIISLSDNGKGIKEEALSDVHSLGIIGMHERAIQFHGKLSFTRNKDNGTTVTLKIPKEMA